MRSKLAKGKGQSLAGASAASGSPAVRSQRTRLRPGATSPDNPSETSSDTQCPGPVTGGRSGDHPLPHTDPDCRVPEESRRPPIVGRLKSESPDAAVGRPSEQAYEERALGPLRHRWLCLPVPQTQDPGTTLCNSPNGRFL